MLRRNFKHTFRNPTAVFNAVLFPVVIMLMFVYVLGERIQRRRATTSTTRRRA